MRLDHPRRICAGTGAWGTPLGLDMTTPNVARMLTTTWAARTTSSRTGSPRRRCSRWCPGCAGRRWRTGASCAGRPVPGPGTVACLGNAVAPGSFLAISHIGTDFFPDKSALAEAVAVYERASERSGRGAGTRSSASSTGSSCSSRAWCPSTNGARSPARPPPARRTSSGRAVGRNP